MKKGFTLIELLVAMAIIGVLATLVLANLSDARDSKRKSELTALKTSLRLYYNDNQTYPTNNASNEIVACGAAGNEACPAEGEFSLGISPDDTVYMKQLPDEYAYTQQDSGQGFLLSVVLENASDPDLTTSAAACGVASPASLTYYVCAD